MIKSWMAKNLKNLIYGKTPCTQTPPYLPPPPIPLSIVEARQAAAVKSAVRPGYLQKFLNIYFCLFLYILMLMLITTRNQQNKIETAIE